MSELTPRAYANRMLPILLERWNNPSTVLQSNLRLGLEYAQGLMPRIPVTALMALTVTSSGIEAHLTGAGYHQIGFFLTPAGPSSGPLLNPDPLAPHNTYVRLLQPLLALGQASPLNVSSGPDSWKTEAATQAWIGVIDYREHGQALNALIPESIQAADISVGQWGYLLCVMSNASTPEYIGGILRKYASQLAGVDEAHRFGALIAAIVNDPNASPNHAKRVLHAWQKLASALALFAQVGTGVLPSLFLIQPADNLQQMQDRITVIANRPPPPPTPSDPSPVETEPQSWNLPSSTTFALPGTQARKETSPWLAAGALGLFAVAYWKLKKS